jgi:predicted small lipoprotein YifL
VIHKQNNFIREMMKKLIALLTMTSVLLAGCVLIPVEEPPRAKACPPGQAKKGNCAPESDRGFCPPGQAKKGAC